MFSRIRPAISGFCVLAGLLAVSPARGAETVALWLFNEQEGAYPSSLLNDCGPGGYFLALGRGGRIVPGHEGGALRAIEPPPFHPWYGQKDDGFGREEGDASLIRFGLAAPPRIPGRKVEPMTWFNATFAAAFVNGDAYLRRNPFANASDSGLNLGAEDWTFEYWLSVDPGARGQGTIFEIGSGPRGENDVFTRLAFEPSDGLFTWTNGSDATVAELRATSGLSEHGWVHCAFVHDAARREIRLYVDGKLQSRARVPNWTRLPHGDEAYCSIARDGVWGRPLAGALDELRVSSGMRYVADFDPPASFSRYAGGHHPPPALLAGPPQLFPDNRAPAGVIELGSRRHLFLDGVLLAERENIEFRGHPARVAEKVLDPADGWISVAEGSDGLIRLYTTGPGSVPLVYVSRDGVHFDAPDLGLGDIQGFRNAASRDPATVGCTFVDPNGPPEERWKMVTGLRGRGGLFVYTSPDGFVFKRNETAALPFWVGSAATVFYDDQRQVYVVHNRSDYFRNAEWGNDRRQVLTEVRDLMRPWPFEAVTPERIREVGATRRLAAKQLDPWWLDNGPLAPGGFSLEFPIAYEADPNLDPIGADIYNTRAQKYAWAPDAYVAFPLVFFHYHNEGPATRKALADPSRGRGTGPVETQLAVSRDGLHWIRYPRPAYVSSEVVDGFPIVRPYTGFGMVRRGREIWQYCVSYPTYHDTVEKNPRRPAIHRLVQRADGFVSADAPYGGGRIVTRPLRFSGKRLVLNIDTGAAGYAQVGLLDEAGHTIPGYSADDCVYINGNEIDYPVEWLGKGADVTALAGKVVSVEIRMRGCSLFAMQFVP